MKKMRPLGISTVSSHTITLIRKTLHNWNDWKKSMASAISEIANRTQNSELLENVLFQSHEYHKRGALLVNMVNTFKKDIFSAGNNIIIYTCAFSSMTCLNVCSFMCWVSNNYHLRTGRDLLFLFTSEFWALNKYVLGH